MHSKLQLLKYPRSLRIVIPSGNLVPYDWGETGVMENIVFLIDLPRRDTTVLNRNKPTLFEEELCYFLRAQGVDEALVKSLAKYDFSATAHYGFVHCITTGDVEIDYVVSSLGSVNMDLISAIYRAAQGDNGLKGYEERSAKNSRGKRTTKAQPETFEDRFQLGGGNNLPSVQMVEFGDFPSPTGARLQERAN
ncbi:hypothetical protein DL769_002935 [Monosporascus sp. CRB-8-3]|nr:hypothetical protein DL769_002935 [Monosporascus sp. CRB-8-3]